MRVKTMFFNKRKTTKHKIKFMNYLLIPRKKKLSKNKIKTQENREPRCCWIWYAVEWWWSEMNILTWHVVL